MDGGPTWSELRAAIALLAPERLDQLRAIVEAADASPNEVDVAKSLAEAAPELRPHIKAMQGGGNVAVLALTAVALSQCQVNLDLDLNKLLDRAAPPEPAVSPLPPSPWAALYREMQSTTYRQDADGALFVDGQRVAPSENHSDQSGFAASVSFTKKL